MSRLGVPPRRSTGSLRKSGEAGIELSNWKWKGNGLERMYRAPTPRERERWHGLWLLAQGWSATQVTPTQLRLAVCPDWTHLNGGWVANSGSHWREPHAPSETGWTTFAKVLVPSGPKVRSLSRVPWCRGTNGYSETPCEHTFCRGRGSKVGQVFEQTGGFPPVLVYTEAKASVLPRTEVNRNCN